MRKRVVILVAVAVAASIVATIYWSQIHRWINDNAPLAEWCVAIGTGVLALATYALALRARQEAEAVREESATLVRQVEIEAEQLVAAQRPAVVPEWGGLSPTNGTPGLQVKNAGAGPALNIRGALYWTGTTGGASSFAPLVLAAGDEGWAQALGAGIDPNWTSAVGYLRYHDLSGDEWQTHFRCRADGDGNRSISIVAMGRTSEFGEPGYNAEQGWGNKPDGVILWEAA